MTLQALIFDVDGTLADSEEAHRLAFNAAFAEAGLPWSWSREQYAEWLKTTGGKERIAAYVHALGLPAAERSAVLARIPALHARKTDFYTEHVRGGALVLRPGVGRLLRDARAAGLRLAIASTTTRENIDALLTAALGADGPGWFAVIATGDDVASKKPAPDIYLKVLAELGLDASDCVAFEDSGRGLAAAKGAGLFTVVTTTYWTRDDHFAGADLVLPSLGDPQQPLDGEDALRAGGTWLSLSALVRHHAHHARDLRQVHAPGGVTLRSAATRGPGHLDTRHATSREQTLTEFIIAEQRRSPQPAGDFTALLNDVRLACKRISFLVGRGALPAEAGGSGQTALPLALDSAANALFMRTSDAGGHLCAMLSPAMAGPYVVPPEFQPGEYLLAFDALEGAGDVEVNVPAASLFSVLERTHGEGDPALADFLQPGTQQRCAGYALYGPTTMLVLTLGRGVHGFTLDRGFGEFFLTHPDMRIADETNAFAINASNERFWAPPVKRYVAECLAGRHGARGRDFSVRGIASLVAEIHRILVRGGVLLHLGERGDAADSGALQLLFHANPLAMLVEQAGGAASTGHGRILERQPAGIGEQAGVIMGARAEVARLARYHAEHAQGIDQPFTSPLFNERSLFTQR